MDEELDCTFKKNNIEEMGYLLGAVYRNCLLKAGFSPDSHIYEIDRPFVRTHHLTKSSLFILRIGAFYDGLSELAKRAFVSEYLEKGRHYRFWWLEYGDEEKYEEALEEVHSKLGSFLARRYYEE